jgi:hypothetical protein
MLTFPVVLSILNVTGVIGPLVVAVRKGPLAALVAALAYKEEGSTNSSEHML